MPDRYCELRDELLELLAHHADLTDADRAALCKLARSDSWGTDPEWAYASGAVLSFLDLIGSAAREALNNAELGDSTVDDLKAILEQHTCARG